MPPKLLNLGFLVDHVLTRDGVVLFHFKFVGHGPLVLVRGVKMTGTRRRIHSNFSRMIQSSDFLAAGTQVL